MDLIRAEKPVVISHKADLLVTGYNTGAPDKQIFNSAAINESIDRQMSILPEGKTVAAIAYVDKEGASVAIVGRIESQIPGELSWTVMGTRKWSGDWDASAALRWTI